MRETVSTPSVLEMTATAAEKVKQLLAEQRDGASMLRVYIQGGGCSGFQYGFDFERSADEGDTVIENAGAKLVVDPMSFQYLVGAEVDYKDDLQGARFVINNPNAATTCGCGSSFSI